LNLSNKILSDIVTYMKYAKYLPDDNRREIWEEIVDRDKNMHIKRFPFLKNEIEEAFSYVYERKVLPSMRSLQFAGKPIEINPCRLFNCSFCHVNHPKVFSEIMFLLLGGSGVGYSVQPHHVEQLPEIKKPSKRTRRFLIGDSIEGWADAIKILFNAYFEGTSTPIFDYSDIRPKGTMLITAGGKAPGPQPLKDCIHNLTKILDNKEVGSKLTPLECHDAICYIADAVLSGGIRRAALICLFSLEDDEMLTCKFGNWWETNPQRARANNSVVLLRHRISKETFEKLWEKIKLSGSGEPGIFFTNDKEWGLNPCLPKWSKLLTPNGIKNLEDIEIGDEIWSESGWTKVTNKWSTGVKDVYEYVTKTNNFYSTKNHQVLSKGVKTEIRNALYIDSLNEPLYNCNGDEVLPNKDVFSSRIISSSLYSTEEVFDITVDNESHTFWCNGFNISNCTEVSLRTNQFCNLVTLLMSGDITEEEFFKRVKFATFIGTLQASYTDFHYLREIWQKTTEKDALLGISMTGLATSNYRNYDYKKAAQIVLDENKRVAELIGINTAARTTLIKPEGTSSCVAGSSSGVHAWHAPYYIRRLRVGKNESIYQYLLQNHPELVVDDYFKPNEQAIIEIPQKAPDSAILRTEPALDLLERVRFIYENWVKPGHVDGQNLHNVSATISIKDDEWDIVRDWMWENRDSFTGLSILPYDGGTYVQAPFEECTKEKYEEMMKHLTEVDLYKIIELTDDTNLSGELACAGGTCEVK
jgi:hypothetical protein